MTLDFPGGESRHKMKCCVENIVLMMFLPAAAAAAPLTTRTSAGISATPNRSLCCGEPSGFALLKLCLSRATLSWLFPSVT